MCEDLSVFSSVSMVPCCLFACLHVCVFVCVFPHYRVPSQSSPNTKQEQKNYRTCNNKNTVSKEENGRVQKSNLSPHANCLVIPHVSKQTLTCSHRLHPSNCRSATRRRSSTRKANISLSSGKDGSSMMPAHVIAPRQIYCFNC